MYTDFKKTNENWKTLEGWWISLIKAAGMSSALGWVLLFAIGSQTLAASEFPGGLVKADCCAHPQGFWFCKMRWGLQSCIFNTFMGETDAAGGGQPLEKHYSRVTVSGVSDEETEAWEGKWQTALM